MTWEVKLNKRTGKRFKKLGKGVNQRLKKALQHLQNNPDLGKSLSGHKGFYSYKAGTPGREFRIVYHLNHEDKVILVDLVAPREEVYEILDRQVE